MILSRIAHRAEWELHCARTLTQKRLWDIWESPTSGRVEKLYHVVKASRIPKPDDAKNHPVYEAANPQIRRKWTDITDEEYAYRIAGPCWLDPVSRFVIQEPHALITLSMPDVTLKRRALHNYSLVPSIRNYLRARAGRIPTVRFPSVISMRWCHEDNYYHCFADILSRLMLLFDNGVDRKTPVVIGKSFAQTRFFEQVRNMGMFAELNWVEQDKQYIMADEIFVARTTFAAPERLDSLLNSLDAPSGNPEKNRRIFLKRGGGGRNVRALRNQNAVEEMAIRYGFESVDPGSLSVREQMEMMSECGVALGVHGAAFTNLLFRRGAPLKILEIFAPHNVELHYFGFAQMFSYDYDFLLGDNVDGVDRVTGSYSFDIPLDLLEAKLAQL